MSINEQSLVTVYIPTFNRLELLQRAVESVCNQTYKNLEIIVVDDCSTDGTQEYLAKLAKEDSRVRYFLKEKNSGACVSRNIAISNARGGYITGLDDDDYFKPNRVFDFIEKIKTCEDNAIIFTNYIVKDDIKETITNCNIEKVKLHNLLVNNYIGNQIFTKTENLRKEHGFDEALEIWQDIDFWIRLSKKYDFIYLKNSSYIIDISDEIVRITKSKVNKLKNSYSRIIEKNSFHEPESTLLKHHFLYYDINLISANDLFSLMRIRPSYLIIKSIIKRFLF